MVGTNEEAVARKKEDQELTDFDRSVARAFGAKNLRIPMTSAVNLRRVADIMHGLATELDRVSRRGDLSARTIIVEAHLLIHEANKKIRELPGKGTYHHPWERE